MNLNSVLNKPQDHGSFQTGSLPLVLISLFPAELVNTLIFTVCQPTVATGRLDPLELPHVGAGNQTPVLEEQRLLLTTDLPP